MEPDGLDPDYISMLFGKLIEDHVTWTQTAIDRLKDELSNDPTGSIREMLKHQKARLSAYRWMHSHNTPKSAQKAISEFLESYNCT